MHLPEIDKYAHLKSMFHSWDPRLKIVSLSFLILVIVGLSDLESAFLALVTAVTLVFVSRIPFNFVFKQLKWVIVFSLFFLVIMTVSVPGGREIKLGFINLYEKGFLLASLIGLRAVSICLIIFPMAGTAKFHETLKAFEKLRVPNKLIQLIMFTYRYIFVFIEEWSRMRRAAESRGFRKRTDIKTLRTTANMTGMLFVRGYERTQRVYQSMRSRGYNGHLMIQYNFKLSVIDFF